MNPRDYIGQQYTGEHGCLTFVQNIFIDEKITQEQSLEEFYEWLINNGIETETPQIGDVAIFHTGAEWHIGYMINSRQMIHAYGGGSSIISDIDRDSYKNTLKGIYRIER